MGNLWRGAAAAALLSGTLAGCATPHYPTSADETRGPPPLTMPKPQYSLDAATAATPAPRPTAPAEAQAEPSEPPTAAPVAPVQSQPLPPAAPSAAGAGAPAAATTQATTDSAPASAAAPVTSTAPATSASPVATQPPPPPTTSAAPTPAPAAAPASPPPPAADEQGLTPQMVVHDQPAAPAPRMATSAPPATASTGALQVVEKARTGARLAIAGEVVSAQDEIFENYEVRKGDHIDALARAFSTTRKVLLDANDVRPPYLLHPGQILKVPVAKAYVAQSGDTLNGVARRFSVGVGELAEINHVSERAMLRTGQRIGLPSSMRDRGPQRINEPAYADAEPPRESRYQYQAPRYTPPPTPSSALTPVSPASATPIPDRGTAGYQTPSPPVAAQAPALTDSQIAAAAHGRFVWPVRGDILAHFGPQGIGRRNDGVDIKAPQGAEVRAAAPGEVVYAGDQVPGFGNLVLIKHADGWVTAYAHLDQINVQMRQQVLQGATLGSVGMSGGATEPELHFEVRYAPTPAEKARPVDPVLVLPGG
jgi:murein DD-endopeptidase MepM/ murein hydrolase activator NlpD